MNSKSPYHNQNKGYESAGQERKNLMNDNPIASRASGGSWMSKHSQSKIGGSPLMAAKPDYIDIDKDGNTSEPMKEAAKNGAKMGGVPKPSPVTKITAEKIGKGIDKVVQGGKKIRNKVIKAGKNIVKNVTKDVSAKDIGTGLVAGSFAHPQTIKKGKKVAKKIGKKIASTIGKYAKD